MSDEEWVILFMLCGKAAEWISADPERSKGEKHDYGMPKSVNDIAKRLEMFEEMKAFTDYHYDGM